MDGLSGFDAVKKVLDCVMLIECHALSVGAMDSVSSWIA